MVVHRSCESELGQRIRDAVLCATLRRLVGDHAYRRDAIAAAAIMGFSKPRGGKWYGRNVIEESPEKVLPVKTV